MEDGIADPFPEINASKQLNFGVPEEFPVDPISSKLESAKFYQEEAAARARARAKAKERAKAEAKESEKNKLVGSTLMSTLLISGVVAAAITAAFIVSKSLKNTS